MTTAYADASALAKLAKEEPESVALKFALEGVDSLLTSVVGRIEFERAVRRAGVADADALIVAVLEGVTVVPIDVAIAAVAGSTRPHVPRTLDAIHLATMRMLVDDLDVVFCYDNRLADAAREHGINVVAPA